ncbi:phage holin family protein [Candidatus Berkelbacteria bacterium]|nr:phage holin family protein [Candidatus Berkelbacteria bacterium]
MFLLLRWFINALTLILVSYLVPGFVVASTYTALIAALILGFANAIIRPILILLTLPITILTLGLFTFVINALMLWFVASFIEGFDIANFTTALVAALILWLVGWVTNTLFDVTRIK